MSLMGNAKLYYIIEYNLFPIKILLVNVYKDLSNVIFIIINWNKTFFASQLGLLILTA